MYWLYDIILALGLVVAWPVSLTRSDWRLQVRERFGRWPDEVFSLLGNRPVVWLHCASVGEVNAARPLITELVARYPGHAFLLTTTTVTGQARARDALGETVATALLPVDAGFLLRPLMRKIRPQALFIFETELWPQLLRAARQTGSRIVLVNGRISARSFGRYRAIRPVVKSMLNGFDMLLMSGAESADRIRHLGARPEKVRVVGNIKWGGAAVAEEAADIGTWAAEGPVLVAGSTHGGEEELLLDAFARVKAVRADARLVLVPRHLKRLPAIESLLQSRGVPYVKRTVLATGQAGGEGAPGQVTPSVLLVDTMGELTRFYLHATVAFLGGSLVPVGGHNMLEPAAAGVPILYGPHVENFTEIAVVLESAGAALRVAHCEELATKVLDLFGDAPQRACMAAAAIQVVRDQSRVTEDYLHVLEGVLNEQ